MATSSRAAASLEPMAASIGREIPSGDDWVFEPKYDGVRVLAHVSAESVRLVTRNGKEKTAQFPEVAAALAPLGARGDLVLDGEIIALQDNRPARFQMLQERIHEQGQADVERKSESTPAALVAFDLLADGGDLLISQPWTERRKRLEARLHGHTSSPLRLSEVLAAGGPTVVERAQRNGWEGVIAKLTDAPYRPGKRTDAWLKLKVEYRQEFVVGGWTEPQRSRKYIGSLLVGYYEAGEFLFAGGVGTGFTQETLRQLLERLRPIEQEQSPFQEPPRTRTPAHWVRPEIVAEVKFGEWTADGRLRQPVFLGTRDDKDPRDVTREATSAQG